MFNPNWTKFAELKVLIYKIMSEQPNRFLKNFQQCKRCFSLVFHFSLFVTVFALSHIVSHSHYIHGLQGQTNCCPRIILFYVI